MTLERIKQRSRNKMELIKNKGASSKTQDKPVQWIHLNETGGTTVITHDKPLEKGNNANKLLPRKLTTE